MRGRRGAGGRIVVASPSEVAVRGGALRSVERGAHCGIDRRAPVAPRRGPRWRRAYLVRELSNASDVNARAARTRPPLAARSVRPSEVIVPAVLHSTLCVCGPVHCVI